MTETRHFQGAVSWRAGFAAAAAALMLAGCGGSPEPETPAPPSVATTCKLDFTWLDMARKSGNLIGASGAQADWTPNCTIRALQSAALTLCVTHMDKSELLISLIRPDGVTKDLPALNSWTPVTTCPPTAGEGWRLDLPLSDLALADYSGRWTVRIVDRFPANTSNGIFHGWAFDLQGLR